MAGLRIQIGSTTLDLPWGYEWSYQTSVALALEWDQMTSGIWRCWDTGSDRDRYTATLPWRVPQDTAALIETLVQSSKGVPGTLLPLEAGLSPFGPLVNLSALAGVRVTASAPQSRAAVSLDWMVQLSIALDPAPVPQGILSLPSDTSWLGADFAARADVSPIQDPGWTVDDAEVGYLVANPDPSAYQCSLKALITKDPFQRIIASLTAGRGAPIVIPAAQNPWGPGVAGTLVGGDHSARPKAWSWSQKSPSLYDFSLTATRIA